VNEALSMLAKAGAEPGNLYTLEDEETLSRMLEEGLITEAEARSKELPLNKIARAIVFKTSEGKKIKRGFENRQRAVRVIDELTASHKWKGANQNKV
jgi:hypothetical protein